MTDERKEYFSILPDIFNTVDTKSNTESHSVLIIRNIIAAFSVLKMSGSVIF